MLVVLNTPLLSSFSALWHRARREAPSSTNAGDISNRANREQDADREQGSPRASSRVHICP